MRPLRCLLIALVVLLMAGSGAFAETCQDAAARLAREYELQWPKPPVTVESRGATATDQSAPSGEPIEPLNGDTATAPETPDEPAPDEPAAPEAAPPTRTEVEALSAEQRTRMEALLLEAVKAEEGGDSERCFERLSEAKAVPSS